MLIWTRSTWARKLSLRYFLQYMTMKIQRWMEKVGRVARELFETWDEDCAVGPNADV